MTPQRLQHVEELFSRVLELPRDQQDSALRISCGSDGALRDEVESLLRHADPPEEFLSGDGGTNAPRAVAAMIALAREHLTAFERAAATLPQILRPAYLPLAPALAVLAKMQGREREMLDSSVGVPAWRRQWAMFRRAARGWG